MPKMGGLQIVWKLFSIFTEKIICFLCLAVFLLDLLPYDVMIVAVLGGNSVPSTEMHYQVAQDWVS